MNLLHTSDWHIGKRLMDRERLSEQEAALSELADICDREDVSVVLVAGDVFDTYLPSGEAEELFFRAVKRLAGEKRAVIIVSGNHDDGLRLAAAAPLAEEQGIYIFGNRPHAFSCGGDRPVHAAEAGEGYLVLEDGRGERVFINALPYPNEARFREDKTEERFSEKISRWIARGGAGYRGGMPYVLLSHLFAAGGATSESEREIDLGGARAVPLSCFPQEGYVALGHLHKPQKLGENVYYSGSLLQYSFDEAGGQKSVNLIRTQGDSIAEVRRIPLTAGCPLVRLEAGDLAQAHELLARYEGALIELTLHLSAPLTAEETHALREANGGLVSLIPRIEGMQAPVSAAGRSRMSASQLFDEFYKARYGTLPDEDLREAFLSMTEVQP